VMLPSIDAPNNAVAVAKRIGAEMERPLTIADQTVHARASIGIAVARPGSVDAKELLRRADVAMYRVKRHKNVGWHLYVDGIAEADTDVVSLESDLRHAIHAGDLRLQYQPIVALGTGELLGVEALVRWQHPSRGWLAPQAFIPLAEQAGIIGDL